MAGLLLLGCAYAALSPRASAMRINRGGIPIQIPRPKEFGGSGGEELPPVPAHLKLHRVPAENILMINNLLEFHQSENHGEFSWNRAVDGDNATQMWVRAPRKGAFLEVRIMGLAGPIARIALLEHGTDFCKNCKIMPIRDASNAAGQGGAQIPFDHSAGEDITLSPPISMQSFRVEVAQTQIIWWQLYELIIWSTMPCSAGTHGRRNLRAEKTAERADPLNNNVRRINPQPHSSTLPPSALPPPPPRPPPQEAVCSPPCVEGHGMCAPRPPHARGGGMHGSGICMCKEGWLGADCATAYCPAGCETVHGLCVAPDTCRCHVGWSGPKCDTQGSVQYGMRLKLGSNRKTQHLLASFPKSHLAGHTAGSGELSPAVATELEFDDELEASARGEGPNWWTVHGPPGTSEAFLLNYTVLDGATVRLRQCTTDARTGVGCTQGGWLVARSQTPAAARRDCKMVGVAPAKGEGSPSSNEHAWYVYVDRGADFTLRSGRAWGLRSVVHFVHVRSGLVMASNGNTLGLQLGDGERRLQLPEAVR